MKNKMLNLLATPFILLAAAAALADIPTIDSTTINGDYEIEFTTGDHVFHDFMQIVDEVFKTVNVKVLYTVLLKFAIKRLIMIPPVYCGVVLKNHFGVNY